MYEDNNNHQSIFIQMILQVTSRNPINGKLSFQKGNQTMQIFINNKNGIPIYDQIYTQIKDQIISGKLQENEPLPSMRNLARDLRISVITTKRAYEELEKEGYIYTIPAKGSYIAPRNLELLREENLKKIEDYMQKIWQLSYSCDLTEEQLMEMFHILRED